MENKSYGHITIGYGTSEQKELEIVDFVKANYIDDRLIHVATIEDESITITVENPVSSGRAPQQSIRLSKESFIGMISTVHLYLQVKGIDISEQLRDCLSSDKINYSFSDNLKPLNEED